MEKKESKIKPSNALLAVPLTLSLITPAPLALASAEQKQAVGDGSLEQEGSLANIINWTGETLASLDPDVIAAREKLYDAQDSLDKASADYSSMGKARKDAAAKAESAKASAEAAYAELGAAESAASNAAAKDSSARSELSAAQKNLDSITSGEQSQAVADAQAAYDSALSAQASAQDARDAAEADAQPARAKLADGAFAFFPDMGAQNCVDEILTLPTKTSIYDETIVSENKTIRGDENDATSIKNMLESVTHLHEFEAIREEAGLSELPVTYEDMAIAMWHCNHSKETRYHTDAWNVGENYMSSAGYCYNDWYYDEKARYEAGDTDWGHIGHYMAIIHPLSVATGYAVNTGSGGDVRECTIQTFNLGPGSGVYEDAVKMTVDEYEANLVGWVAQQNSAIDAATAAEEALEAAKAAAASAKEKLDAAKDASDAGKAQERVDAAKGAAKAAAAELDAANAALASAQARADEADAAKKAAAEALAAIDEGPQAQALERAQAEMDAAEAALEAAEKPYSYEDVDYGLYYGPAVAKATKDGIMSGYSDGTMFGPDDTMTRGQLATVLWRAACPDEASAYDAAAAVNTSGMDDVADGMYYTAAANWAAENGIINGFDEGDHREFRPSEAVTMEQLCCIVASFRGEAYGTENLEDQAVEGFTDGAEVSTWAVGSVNWAAKQGWVSGYENADGSRTLRPWEALSRGRTATILENAALLTAHEHEWSDSTEQVWVPEVIIVKEAWDEPVYEEKSVGYCGVCNIPIDGDEDHGWEVHVSKGDYSYWSYVKTEKVQTGTVHHDAVTENRGHYEYKVASRTCIGCGAEEKVG